jgi:hypothetical protein
MVRASNAALISANATSSQNLASNPFCMDRGSVLTIMGINGDTQ